MLVMILRFIPTYVGNTQHLLFVLFPQSVHPHVCGEHIAEIKQWLWLIGSSPRMWGTPDPDTLKFLIDRFIPTYVGNTKATPRQR